MTLGPANHNSPGALSPLAGTAISAPVSVSMILLTALGTVQPTELSGASTPHQDDPPSNGMQWLTGLSSLMP